MKTNNIIKYTWLMLIFMLIVVNVFSQDNQLRDDPEERLKARKIAIITERLELTVEEAQNFWPLYNEMEKKRDELNENRKEAMKKLHKDEGTLSEEDQEKLILTMLDSKIEDATLSKEYYHKFKKILPVAKVVELYHTEQQFKKDLLKDIRGHRGPGPHRGPPQN